MAETAQYVGLRGDDAENRQFQARARAKLFSPGQPMAVELAKNPTALIVNNTLFAHGGVLPEHGELSRLIDRESISLLGVYVNAATDKSLFGLRGSPDFISGPFLCLIQSCIDTVYD